MRRTILALGIIGGIVIGLGVPAWVVATGMLGPDDGLDCRTSNQRGYTTSEFDPGAGPGSAHARTPDEEIEQSDLWSFYDIPKTAWHLVPGDDAPANGILRVESLAETPWDPAEYLVYVDGSGVLRATVEPVGDRYFVTGWTTC